MPLQASQGELCGSFLDIVKVFLLRDIMRCCLYLSDKKVIEEKCHTEKIGVGQFRIMAHNAIMDNFGKKIDPAVVESFIFGRKTDISEKYISVLEKAAENYCRQLTDTMEKYEYDSDFMKLYVAGGGGVLLKRYGKYEPSRNTSILKKFTLLKILLQKKKALLPNFVKKLKNCTPDLTAKRV